jgi:GNAT superfamily N-acetyltransferase
MQGYRVTVQETATIRRAGAADAGQIVRHGARMFESMGETDIRCWIPEAERALREGIEAGHMVAALAENISDSHGAISSAVAVLWERLPTPWNASGRCAYIQYVWTEPLFRRRGIARRVMGELIRWLRDDGVALVELNAAAMAESLYRSMGFADPRNPPLRLAL